MREEGIMECGMSWTAMTEKEIPESRLKSDHGKIEGRERKMPIFP